MRNVCLVDGLNLYHSLTDAIEDGASASIKWLDIQAMCQEHLSTFNNRQTKLTNLYYFTSLPVYRKDGAVQRHKSYIKAIEAAGFQTIYGYFQDKTVRCEADCRKEYTAHVEKQTELNIALKLMELFHSDECDGCLMITGDGDLLSAVRTARKLFPSKVVAVAFPYKRWNPELSIAAAIRIKLSIEHYKRHMLPDPMPARQGKLSHMPKAWKSGIYFQK